MVSLASGTLKKKFCFVVFDESGCFRDASGFAGVVLQVLMGTFVVDAVVGWFEEGSPLAFASLFLSCFSP